MDADEKEEARPRPYRLARRLNLGVLMAEAGGPAALERLTGTPKSHYSAMTSTTNTKPRNVGDDIATKVELAMHRPHGWMDLFHPELYVNDVDDLPPTLGALAQALSHPGKQTLLLTWGDLMSLKQKQALPDLFRAKMPDNSMEPRVPEGRAMLFSTMEAARAGDGVLVADREGNLYVRTYRERRPGVWTAKAENADYEDLESERDGLEVVAVLLEMGRWSA